MSSKLYEKLKAYKNYANDCIHFKFIFDENDLNSKSLEKDQNEETSLNLFKPEFTHQIFGDDEEIFGYKGLKIDYYLTPGYLDAYIGLSCKEKVTPQRFDGIEPDDVYSAFKQFGCSPNFTRNIDVFSSDKLKADKEFKPFGQKIYEYSRSIPDSSSTNKFEIFKVDSTMNEYNSESFLNYILNVQTMLIYYIETASFVDTDDSQWTHYLLYENKKIGSETRYVTFGYLSVYNYYAYPDKTRSRVSQVLVLPPYQKAGHGAELLAAVYRDACENPGIIDVTAESPSPEFIRLRDYVTTKMCASLNSFRDKSKLKLGFSNEMAQEALKKYKIPKLQSRRSYEILRMSATDENNSNEWKDFRLDIKKRFYLPFIRKSKYARNAGTFPGSSNETNEPASNPKPTNAFESRFGGETTIGFGEKKPAINGKPTSINARFGNEDSGSSTSIGFGSSNGFAKPNGVKSVSFKTTSLNTSNSTTDEGSSEDEDEDKEPTQLSANLFVSEAERKKYLEEQFQESVKDYRKIVERLEDEQILPF